MLIDLSFLNKTQQAAVLATEGPVLVLAGAGSGKTRLLTYKAAHLMANGVPPENILLSTFTNKAANEMKERIVRLVGKWAVGSVGNNQKTYKPTDPQTHLPFVGTFHAFCAKLLRIDGKHAGIPSGFLIYDDDDSLSLVKRIMKD